MQNLLKNKLLIILVLFVILMSSISINSFASTDINLPPIINNYGEEYSSFIKLSSDGSIYLYTYFTILTFTKYDYNGNSTYSYYYKFSFPEDSECTSYVFNKDTFSWDFYQTKNIDNFDYGLFFPNKLLYVYNIENDEGVNISDYLNTDFNLVFQEAPQEITQVELMKATQVEEIPQQIAKIVMIVLPVFLAIFGTLLVLYLIKSKNLLHL